MTAQEDFRQENGVFIPNRPLHHRDDQYDEHGFDVLIKMQREHFWYQGRHKLILKILQQEIHRNFGKATDLLAIDMGGGCGGWVEYLHNHAGSMFKQLALSDSSIRALSLSEAIIGSFATRYQIDLLDIPWFEKWDIVFLLDVLEHIPEHQEALKQIRKCMRPGGLLFITTPALKFFWTYNDDVVHHQRRYSKKDFQELAIQADMELLRTEYFMFLLSPILFLNRTFFRPPKFSTPEQIQKYIAKTHEIPIKPVNTLLARIFSIESSIIDKISFPWGTSILSVFRC